MITLISGIVSIISALVGWYFGAAHQAKKENERRKREMAKFKKALAAGDIDTLRKLFGD